MILKIPKYKLDFLMMIFKKFDKYKNESTVMSRRPPPKKKKLQVYIFLFNYPTMVKTELAIGRYTLNSNSG